MNRAGTFASPAGRVTVPEPSRRRAVSQAKVLPVALQPHAERSQNGQHAGPRFIVECLIERPFLGSRLAERQFDQRRGESHGIQRLRVNLAQLGIPTHIDFGKPRVVGRNSRGGRNFGQLFG